MIDTAPAAGAASSWGNAGHIAIEQVEPLASWPVLRSGALAACSVAGGALGLPPSQIKHWLPFAVANGEWPASMRVEHGREALRSLLDERAARLEIFESNNSACRSWCARPDISSYGNLLPRAAAGLAVVALRRHWQRALSRIAMLMRCGCFAGLMKQAPARCDSIREHRTDRRSAQAGRRASLLHHSAQRSHRECQSTGHRTSRALGTA